MQILYTNIIGCQYLPFNYLWHPTQLLIDNNYCIKIPFQLSEINSTIF